MAKKFEHSSGNVFADLGIDSAEEVLAKAELARQINIIIKQKRLTQEAAASLLGVDQPKVSALMAGKLAGFSFERLFKFLNDLGQDVVITVKAKARSRAAGLLSVKRPVIKNSIKSEKEAFEAVMKKYATVFRKLAKT